MSITADPLPHVIDVTTDTFEEEVLRKSLSIPILVEFWAEWCAPCKQLGPVLEKVAADYHGAFVLARIDVEKEQQLGAAFQVRSIPSVYLLRDGELFANFAGALPEAQVHEFLKTHGVTPADAPEKEAVEAGSLNPYAEVIRLRQEMVTSPEADTLKLDLALLLLQTGEVQEAEQLLESLPASLGADDRALRARARLALLNRVEDAPAPTVLEQAIATDPDDLGARYLLGSRLIVGGQPEAGLEQLIEMLRRDRNYESGLPRKALIEAFLVVDDDQLVSRFRRRMASLLF
ncbi:MAG: tetratricopeptide repeat protein [Pseudomonadota bacterium]|nr:tetratricopeptide repeat protein [Pseudomonadota bacterium]